MRGKIVVVIKPILFVFVFCLLFQRISLVLQVYGSDSEDPDRHACLFFSLPKNTVDVLFVGTSRVYGSYIPQQIYDDTGISSAVLATSTQSYQNTYWLLKEALQHQQPELVILDIHRIITPFDLRSKDYRLYYTSGISALPDMSINKIFAYKDITSDKSGWAREMTIYDAYGFFEYKNEYDRGVFDPVEIANLILNPVSEYRTLGYFPTETIYPMKTLQPNITSTSYIDLKQTVDFLQLQRIIAMLDEKKIPLLLVRAPYNGEQFDDHQLYSQAFDWIEEQKIPCIDFFKLIDEIGINPKTDFCDINHMNYLGAKKTTIFLENYLKKKYSLKDHRGDEKYELWENLDYNYEAIEKRILDKLAQ